MGILLQPLDEVLTSRSKVRLLRAMLSTEQPLSGREAARLARVGRVPAARSLDELVALGVLHRQRTTSQHLYTLNRQSYLVRQGLAPLYQTERERVERIFDSLRSILREAPGGEQVKGAWIFGSAARGQDTAESDLDVLVVVEDEPGGHEVHAHLAARAPELEQEFGLRLSPVVVTRERLRAMHADEHALVRDVLHEGRRITGVELERLLR